MSQETGVANPVMAAAFAKAEAKKAVTAAKQPSLADQILAMSDEETAKAADQARARKAQAQAKAVELAKIQQALEKIYAVSDWEFNSQFKEAAEKLVRQMEELGESDDVQFALLIHRVKSAPLDRESVRKAFASVAAAGRGQPAATEEIRELNDGKVPSNAVFFEDLCLVAVASAHMPDGEQSKADHYLFEALRRLKGRFYKAEERAEEKLMDAMRDPKVANHDLDYFLRREAGRYLLNFKARGESKAGTGVIELYYQNGRTEKDAPALVVEVVDGAGSLRFMRKLKGFRLFYGLFFNLRDQEREERLEKMGLPHDIDRDLVKRFVSVVRGATVSLRRKHARAKEAERSAKEAKIDANEASTAEQANG